MILAYLREEMFVWIRVLRFRRIPEEITLKRGLFEIVQYFAFTSSDIFSILKRLLDYKNIIVSGVKFYL